MTSIEVRTMGFSYKAHRVFDACDLALRGGRIYGLIGPNGSGKTTLLNLLCGRYKPLRGEIDRSIPTHAIGMLAQDQAVFAQLTVRESFDFFGMLNRDICYVPWARLVDGLGGSSRDRAESLAQRLLWALSTGERRWLYLEWLLQLRPLRCFLLDEPTAGVDPEYRMLIGERIRESCSDQRLIVVASHLLDELGGLCDEILLIRKRRIESYAGISAFIGVFGGVSADAAFVAAMREIVGQA
jgi:ABC-2 type transport system ATP-binding protein